MVRIVALDLNSLRKLGFTRRQSDALAPALGPADSIVAAAPYQAQPYAMNWLPDSTHQHALYLGSSFTPPFTQVTEVGDAFELGETDPNPMDNYTTLTYRKAGVYLCSFVTSFATDDRGWDGSIADAMTTPTYIRFGDDWALTSETPQSLGGISFPTQNTLTWMVQVEAGDVGSLPYVRSAITCRPMSLVTAEFRAVRLLA